MADDLLAFVIAAAVLVLAAVATWVEARVEQREQQPPHREVLAREPKYRAYWERWRGK